ncbi:MAG: helix-turn-helix domain-containing protein [Pseudomonadota bacterium]|nr:helix-turn-helix domain-containing protein [Pseudomonadota bacterium]
MLKRPAHKEDIKAAIRKRHGSLAAFELARGLPRQSTRDVLRGRAVSKTAHAIAVELDTTVESLFPGRFKSHNRDNIRKADAAHRQNAEAR